MQKSATIFAYLYIDPYVVIKRELEIFSIQEFELVPHLELGIISGQISTIGMY